jgi:large subunit ribosomal protein L18
MDMAQKRLEGRITRHRRIRKKVNGTTARPRLCVRRTLVHMDAQIVDDATGKSLVQTSTTSKDFQAQNGSLNKTEQSRKLGALVAALAKEKNIEQVVFDRGGYTYHGRVKAFADAAREAGMVF